MKTAQDITKEEVIERFKTMANIRLSNKNQNNTNQNPSQMSPTTNLNANPTNSQGLRSILRSNQTWYNIHFGIKAELTETTMESRAEEITNIVDTMMDICRKNGIQIMLIPRNDPEGTPIKTLGRDTTTRFETNKKPTFSKYINPWITKPNQWTFTTIQLNMKCSVPINELYYKTATQLKKKTWEMVPRKLSMKNINVIPLAGLLPAINTLDTKALCFEFQHKYGLNISFETAKILNGKWTNCGARDENCAGYIVTVEDDTVSERLNAIKKEWPAFKVKENTCSTQNCTLSQWMTEVISTE